MFKSAHPAQEYKFYTGPAGEVTFNAIGAAGWQLVASYDNLGERTWVFMREKE